jgi:putative ABC transport system permease protein
VILLLGILATILSAAGIYGAVSFAVNQTTHEFGIRAALGALGLWLSVATAAALSKTLDTAALRIDNTDPLLYIAAVVILAGDVSSCLAGREFGPRPGPKMRLE